ncbi:sulfotransferase family 2 domain-containing protein [Thiocapsa sp. UBA6158]|uniref:sulfotransferase family 2 domain-containing protein n=1 Tax=Thiocapsa sp. UBA6158 TaxID=1947692 RepID=UPI0025E01960|nr:sulfotransferase family 2 domain-containing protein [Thiocapsa sp. UBA6158]
MTDTLLFIHIPKTAGTSVRVLLQDWLEPEELVLLYGESPGILESEFRAWSDEEKVKVRLGYGHFHYGLHEALPQHSKYVTLMREPVDRVLSLYYFYRDVVTGPANDLIVKNRLDIRGFLTGGFFLQSDNEMVRMISGLHPIPFGTCGPEHLEIALQHLEEDFADVLFVDTIHTGLARLHRTVCRKDTGFAVGRENCNTERPKAADLDEETIELLMHATRWDRRLYEAAKRRFEPPSRRLDER